jgi:hypothetical protein
MRKYFWFGGEIKLFFSFRFRSRILILVSKITNYLMSTICNTNEPMSVKVGVPYKFKCIVNDFEVDPFRECPIGFKDLLDMVGFKEFFKRVLFRGNNFDSDL